MAYRATRNEPRVGVGEWTGDFFRDQVYEPSHANEEGVYPRGRNLVPDYLCDYLVSHGILENLDTAKVVAAPAPPVSPQPRAISVTPLTSNEPLKGIVTNASE